MKKVFRLAAIAIVAMAMTTACNNNAPEEVVEDTIVEEVVEDTVIDTVVEEVVEEPVVETPTKPATKKATTQKKDNTLKVDAKNVEANTQAKRSADLQAVEGKTEAPTKMKVNTDPTANAKKSKKSLANQQN